MHRGTLGNGLVSFTLFAVRMGKDQAMEPSKVFDAAAFGQVVKNARKARGLTRNQVAEELSIAPRYLMSIENSGQTPSLQVFFNLVTLFDISVDRLFYGDVKVCKSVRRKQMDALLSQLTETDILVLESTAQGILKARKARESSGQTGKAENG